MGTLAEALSGYALPEAEDDIAEWAANNRIVSRESGSPIPGRWRNDTGPYLVEIMQRLSPSDPCRSVTFRKSHQVGGTECSLNLFGYTAHRVPAPMLIVLPTIDEAHRFNKVKLRPAIDATPGLAESVMEQKARSTEGSTVGFKKFKGGAYCQLTGANSSAGLQMLSAKILIAEEISEWPAEAGDRGDPLALAEKRTTAWLEAGVKKFFVSTPGIAGMCRVSEKYDESDQRQFYVPCPHCKYLIVLEFKNLEQKKDDCVYNCQACGSEIESAEKPDMVACGVWVPTFPEKGFEPTTAIAPEDLKRWLSRDLKGREPGYHINQLYSPFVPWADTMAAWADAEGSPEREKVFSQQVLGVAWEETRDVPQWQRLVEIREGYETGRMPPGALVLTGMADVQKDRIEYAVYGWGVGMSGWLVDRGFVPGDPATDKTWLAFEKITARTYPGERGLWPVEAYGVDAGYLSQMVYRFVRGRQRIFALDGRGGHTHPLIGAPKRQGITFHGKRSGTVLLWPTGTWPAKSWIYAALRRTIEGEIPCLHFPMECDDEFFRQLTAEYLAKIDRGGRVHLEWRKSPRQANEQLDIAVGALAMASHMGLDRYTEADWQKVAGQRKLPLGEHEAVREREKPSGEPTQKAKASLLMRNRRRVSRSKFVSG